MPLIFPRGRRSTIGTRALVGLLAAVSLLLSSCSLSDDSTPTSAADARPAPPQEAAQSPAEAASPPPKVRSVTEQNWTPFATVGGILLMHPAQRIERVAFHESNHEGARQMDALPSAVEPVTLESRQRRTASRTAADIVIDPSEQIGSYPSSAAAATCCTATTTTTMW